MAWHHHPGNPFNTDGIRVFAANAWMSYQLEQLAKEVRSEVAEVQRRAEARLEILKAKEAESKMQSHKCWFWWEQ